MVTRKVSMTGTASVAVTLSETIVSSSEQAASPITATSDTKACRKVMGRTLLRRSKNINPSLFDFNGYRFRNLVTGNPVTNAKHSKQRTECEPIARRGRPGCRLLTLARYVPIWL